LELGDQVRARGEELLRYVWGREIGEILRSGSVRADGHRGRYE
jgi:hypothetical protein